jgi:hypothetical protein
MSDEESPDEWTRFVRWQKATREHLGATSNVILGLATGLLAFAAPQLLQKKPAQCDAMFGAAACVLLVASIAFALWCAINRLSDFRLTAQIANPNKVAQVAENRLESLRLGERTWMLFRAQVWTFAFGAAAMGVAIILQLHAQ